MNAAIVAKDVAEWMLRELQKHKNLYQEEVVYQIKKQFGDQFVYDNENGNLAISKTVLSEFRSLTEGLVVWERGERCWRYRAPYDPQGKRGVE